MGSIVGGFVVPHNPLIFQNPKGAKPDQHDQVMAAYAEVGRRIGALGATTAIVLGTDHYVMFGPGCLPSLLIATGDLEGPLERLHGLDRVPIPNNAALAAHIMTEGFEAGIDWAVAKAMTVDHSVAIPYFMSVRPNGDIPLIPIYLQCGVQPFVRLSRARVLGRILRAAVESGPADERVVVIGSGGISHWVGEAEMGQVNEEFDREILGLIEAADADALGAYRDDDIIARGGNGALEIRNFLCAMEAVGARRGEVIAYAPVPGWITGLGFAQLHV
jgi:protocatechuate 4,5-dioxygenase beta chain